MAKVGWSAGIDFVSGALSKPSKNGQHSCQKMLLGTHRTAATTNPNCNRIYLRPKIERSTPPTVNELFMRQRFAAVKAAVKARMEDLSKVDADQAAFIAQKDTAGGKRTIVRCSAPARLIVPPRKVNLPIRVPPLIQEGALFLSYSLHMCKRYVAMRIAI